jgi:hypothetical protein
LEETYLDFGGGRNVSQNESVALNLEAGLHHRSIFVNRQRCRFPQGLDQNLEIHLVRGEGRYGRDGKVHVGVHLRHEVGIRRKILS